MSKQVAFILVNLFVVHVIGCAPSPKVEMNDAEMKLDSFRLEGIWFGTIHVPWLGGDVQAIVDAEDSGIVETQFNCIRTACSLPKNTLQKCQRFLFNHYQNEIYGSVTAYVDGKEIDFRELTPEVSSKEQLWDLLSEMGLGFPPEHRIDDDCYFELRAECPWDEEHGLAVLFNKNGEPIAVGGQGEHF